MPRTLLKGGFGNQFELPSLGTILDVARARPFVTARQYPGFWEELLDVEVILDKSWSLSVGLKRTVGDLPCTRACRSFSTSGRYRSPLCPISLRKCAISAHSPAVRRGMRSQLPSLSVTERPRSPRHIR